MDPISERIENMRLYRGLSARTLATLSGTGQHRYGRRVRGEGTWKTKDLAAIARILRVRVEWLTDVNVDAA